MFNKKQPTTKILRFLRSTHRKLGFITLLVKNIQVKLFNRHDRHWKKMIGRWQKGKKLFLLIAIFILLLLGPTVYLTLIHPKSTEAAPWAQTASSWTKRKNVILTNNSGQTFEANTTYAVNINTQELVAAGDLNADCSDLRVYYQPTDTTSTKLAYYFDVAAGATNCSDSLATKIYFPLQANLSNGTNATEYYIYYDNASAVTEASVDAFNVGSKQALMVCPFNGDTECINGDGAEDPTTESGAIRYSGGKGAISFNGADVSIQADYISLGSPDSLDDMISGKQITFESWVKVDKIGCHQYFTSTDWGGGGGGWHAYWGCDGTPTGSFSIICGTQNAYSLPTTTLPVGEWFHYATTYDDNGDQKIHIFVNGSEVSYTTQNACTGGVTSDAARTKYLWHDEWSSGAKQGGEIDEFRISSVVRYTSNFTPQTSPYVRDEHTKLLLHFDENGDDPRNTGKVIDDSGNGNHGTITGAQYVAGVVGVDASTTDTGKTPSASYASHDGIFIEEGTTNKITNPSFDHSTYNTNWNDATNLTETENSTAQFSKFGSKSAKLVASADDSFYIAINAGNTNSHTLSAYVYDGTSSNVGGTISSSIAALVFNGSAQTTTYTDMGGGWWRLSYSAAAGSGSQNYGVQVKSGKTVYVDGVQLEEKAYSTTYADGTLGTGYSWSGTAHASTSSRTVGVDRYATTNNIDRSQGAISIWYRIDRPLIDSDTAFGLISFKDDTSQILGLEVTNCQWQSRFRDGSETSQSFNGDCNGHNGSTGKWHHVVLNWQNGTQTLYRNTSLKMTTAFSTGSSPGSNPYISIGEGYSAWDISYPTNGVISEVRIYSTPLTATEVADLYYTGLGSHQIQSDYTERFSGTEGPVLNWHMDEGYGTTAHDSTLKTNNGTISGATWNEDTFSSPPQGKSLQLDGGNDYVYRTYTADDELDPSSLPFSVSTWFKHPSTQAGTDTLIARYANSGYKLYMNSSGYLCFGVDDDSTWGPDDSACSTISYADSQWHLATAVRESSSIALYVDGIKVASDDSLAITGHLSGANPTLYAGIDSDGSSNPWSGFIDDVRVYSHALTTAEILAELSARGSVKGTSTTFTGEGAGGDLSQGLVGYWKMDEASWNGSANEVVDASGNANHGVRSGDATTTTGKYGSGGTFDGTGDYIDLGDPTSLSFTTAFTYSAYVKPNTFIDSEVLYFGGAGDKLWLRINSIGQLAVYLGGTSNPGYHASINSLVDAQWNLVTLVYDGTKAKIYINGIFDSEINTSGTLSDSGTRYSVKIGANYAGGGNYFKGDLDEVRLYNRALSPNEISALYFSSAGPIAYYTFEEGSGGTVNDLSGSGLSGSSSGTYEYTNGKFGKGLKHAGGSYTVASGEGATFSSNKLTASAWVYRISDSGTDEAIIHNEDSNGDGWKILVTSTDNAACYHNNTESLSAGSLSLNTWYYITCSWDGATQRIYVNGVQSNFTAISGSIAETTDMAIGARSYGLGNNRLYGVVDEVKIYNYTRTPAQIIEDMNAGHPAPGSPVGSPIGYWKFDEGYADTANDSSPQNIDGNLSGSTTCPSATICPTWSDLGKFGKALYFGDLGTADGDSHVRLTNDVYDTQTQGAISIWFKPDDAGDNTQNLFAVGGSTTDFLSIQLNNTDNTLVYGIKDENAVVVAAASPAIQNFTNWHHFVWNMSASGNELFIDGVKQGMTYAVGSSSTDAWFDNLSDNATSVYSIGCIVEDTDTNDCLSTELFKGYLDEIKIYSSPLTADQVKVEYNQGKSQVLGALSTASDGTTADNSAARAYCPPGNTEGNCAAGQNPAPIAHFNFDEGSGTTAQDISGNSLTGTISGSASYQSGKYDHALELGSGKFVTLTGEGSTLSTNNKTISAWIYRTSDSGFDEYIIDNQDANGDGWFMFISSLDKLECYYNGAQSISSDSLSVGRWYHIACATDGSTQKLYLDGVQVDNDSITGSISESNDARIGARSYTSPSGYLNALVDDFRIYAYARTSTQIAWDYNRGAPAAWYKLDECDGGTLHSTNATYNTGLNGTWYGTSSGSQTTVGSCATVDSAWYNGSLGKFNASLNFDGTDDYVSLGDSNTINFSANQGFTINGWLKTTENYGSVVSFRNSSSGDPILDINLGYNGDARNAGYLSIYVREDGRNGSAISYTSSKTVNNGQWQLFTLVRSPNSGTINVYINGVYDGTASSVYADGGITTNLRGLGAELRWIQDAYGTTDDRYFSGQIDDVRVYNYALSEQQIKLIYNGGQAVEFR